MTNRRPTLWLENRLVNKTGETGSALLLLLITRVMCYLFSIDLCPFFFFFLKKLTASIQCIYVNYKFNGEA